MTLLNKKLSSLVLALTILLASTLSSNTVQATIVEFNTSHGNFKVNLHDKTTPLTVANFLKYVTNERYNNTVIHRLETNFVVQGGGFSFNNKLPLEGIEIFSPVKNEPVYSNVRGTIAMAKQANSPNSATSQWFISLGDNSKNLDVQNGGFTAFGEVIEDGMTVLDNIAALPRCSNTPVNNNSTANCKNPSAENFVTVYQITVLDEADTTDTNLNSAKNTLINQSPKTDNNTDSGGSMLWLLLLLAPIRLLKPDIDQTPRQLF